MIKISLDAMGGDHGPGIVVPAAIASLERYPELQLTLVGRIEVLEKKLSRRALRSRYEVVKDRLALHDAQEVVAMDESPALALRNKKDSSMRIAINLVKEGKAHACVSAGNTGALMATARFVLKTLPGVDRPAILALLPNLHGAVRVLDMGANVDATAEQLQQFAVMGSILTAAVAGIEKPRIGLLNVGAEDIKGNEQVKQTAELLSANEAVNYIGFVEGDDILMGDAHVIVCDGFVGNVALKACEGTAKFFAKSLRDGFSRNFLTKLAGFVALPVLRRLKKQLDPGNYNGASLVGLQGIVVKSHGNAKADSFANAIREAMLEVERDVPKLIGDEVAHLLQEAPTL